MIRLLAIAVFCLMRAVAQNAAQLQAASDHLQHGSVQQAIRECKTVLAADPQSGPAHMLLGQAYLASADTAMLAEAKAELQQALALDPNLLWARFYLARAYLDLGMNEKAQEQLERGLHDRPDVPHFLSLLGEANRKGGNPSASVELNRKSLAIDPSMTPAHYYLALAYLDLKQDDRAAAELEAALNSPYVSPEMYVTLAGLYLKKQRFGDAENLCRRAIALDPGRPEAYVNLARTYNAQHAPDKALAALKQALPDGKQFPASAFYQQVQSDICFERGVAYQAKALPAQAIDSYTCSADFDPGRGEAHLHLAELYHRQGDSGRAVEHATQAEKAGVAIPPRLRDEIFRSH